MSNNSWLRKQCTNFLDSKLNDTELEKKSRLIREAARNRGMTTGYDDKGNKTIDEVADMIQQIKQERENEKEQAKAISQKPTETPLKSNSVVQRQSKTNDSSNSRTEPHGKPERAPNRHNPAPSGTVRTGPTGTRKTGAWTGKSILDMADERKL